MVGQFLISARERLLDRLLNAHHILNPPVEATANAPALSADELPALLSECLKRLKADALVTPDGRTVLYESLREHPDYRDLHILMAALRTFDPAGLRNRQERLAFWINLYNLLVIDAVIQLQVRRSVSEQMAGFAFFRRAAYQIGGQRFSLDMIEHGILRDNKGHPFIPGPQFAPRDPRCAWIITPMDVRIHFALNCASQSCPPIAYYEASRLDAQLDLAARNFVHAETQYDPGAKQLCLSRIFRWYAGDFGGQDGVLAFVRRYLPDGQQVDDRVRIVYSRYDWKLNRGN